MNALLAQHCSHRVAALGHDAALALLAQVPGWAIVGGKLCRDYALRDYHEAIAFVNALAAMIHAEDHHPEMTVTYKQVSLRYDTHSVQGLSENDFICAAKADAIYAARSGA